MPFFTVRPDEPNVTARPARGIKVSSKPVDINTMNEKRYSVSFPEKGVVLVNNRRTNKTLRLLLGAFIYGTVGFDERTLDLPQYVYLAVAQEQSRLMRCR